MAIDLREFASGDTDYIAKLNFNVIELENAINALETAMGTTASGGAVSMNVLLDTLFNHADALIGPNSYKPTLSASTASVAPGGAYLAATQTVVQSSATVPVSFVGQPAGTYYLTITASGITTRFTTLGAGASYSVFWNGAAFAGPASKIMPVFFDTAESEASRDSTALAHVYTTLDARLEAGEALVSGAADQAQEALDTANEALDAIHALEAEVGLAAVYAIRKVGCTVDDETGVKGAIQVDFNGTIIGWSIIANAVGDLTVEIDRAASSAPPAVPTIPNTTTDKISASAPVQLSAAQSASRGAAGVSTWNTAVNQWDVIQFYVASVSGITRATLYLRIQEAPPPEALTLTRIAATSVAQEPFLITHT